MSLHLVGVTWTDSSAGCPYMLIEFQVKKLVDRGHDMRALRQEKILLGNEDPFLGKTVNLIQETRGIDHATVTDDISAPRSKHPGGKHMKDELLPVHNNGMPFLPATHPINLPEALSNLHNNPAHPECPIFRAYGCRDVGG